MNLRRIVKGVQCFFTGLPGEFDRNQRFFIGEGLAANSYATLTGGVFLTGLALYMGASDTVAGFLTAAPLIASVAQVFLVLIWNWVKNPKKAVMFCTYVSRCLVVSMILIPFVVPKGIEIYVPILGSVSLQIAILFLIQLVANLFMSAVSVRFNLWLMDMLPITRRGRFLSVRDRVTITSGTILSLASSWILDGCKAVDRELIGYCIIIGMAAFFVAQSYYFVSNIDYYDREDCTKKHSIITIFTEPLKNRQFIPVLLYFVLWNLAAYMTSSYVNVYLLSDLKISYTAIMLCTLLANSLQIISGGAWGKYTNRFTWKNMTLITGAVVAVTYIMWGFISTPTILMMPLIYIISGLNVQGYNIATANLPLVYMQEGRGTVYLGFMNAANCLAGVLGTSVGAWMITGIGDFTIRLGTFVIGAKQLVFITSGMILFLDILIARFLIQKQPRIGEQMPADCR